LHLKQTCTARYDPHEMPGLRERKKERTRDAIVKEALALFRKRGYEATTIADIAEAADIAPRTFFAYFETKEAVVFHDFEESRERFAQRLRERGPDETTFDALRAWLVQWIGEHQPLSAAQRARRKLIRSTPALQAREQAHRAVFEELIAQSVAGELGLPADSLRPRMVSAAAVAALYALEHREEDPIDTDQAIALVDEALAFLEGGLDVLRRQALARGR
jgi:AcrR family transcriptional regulator